MQTIYSKTIEKPCGFLFARWSAGAKAFELSLPPAQRIITDPYAPYYSGQVGRNLVAAMSRINPAIRKGIVLRARFMDEYARTSFREGIQQVVLLGAGYDSRYLRMPEFRSVRVFELDLESTQTIKKSLTRRMLGRLPENVTYLPMDFSKDVIGAKLMTAGYRRALKTLFIWEGVTLFLNREIIAETLGRLAELGEGNRVVFDFIPSELVDDETDYQGNRQLLEICKSINEPLTFGSSPKAMTNLLKTAGFAKVNITSMREAHRMYCGSDRIEDSYFFATAEAGGDNVPANGNKNGVVLL